MTEAIGRTIFSKTFECDAIAAGAIYKVPLTENEKWRYNGFNAYDVVNISNQRADIRYGGGTTNIETLPAGSARILKWTEGLNFRNLYIHNAGSAQIDKGEIMITIKKIIPVRLISK